MIVKELGIEEKAKRYDEVVNKLKGFMAQGVDPLITRADAQDFFPELKESEDERIRKSLATYFANFKPDYMWDDDFSFGDIVAWLEKQGGHAKFINGIQVGDKVTRNEDGVLVNLSQLNRVAKKDEKQGEQKEHDVCDFCEQRGYCIDPCSVKLLDKYGMKDPADGAEPKFKVGDWIVRDGKTLQISRIYKVLDGTFHYWFTVGTWLSSANMEDAHLWTINDARDGDVLNSMRVQATIIFKGFADDSKHILAYCALQKGIFIKQEMLWDRDFEPCPKNWNNELFSKMKEAGYEWNAEKKELSRLEEQLKQL